MKIFATKKRKILVVVLSVLIVGLYMFYQLARHLAPGSYPFTEIYEFRVSEAALIKAVDDFKSENPKYLPPEGMDLIDGRHGESDYWYHVYFYDREDNILENCWIRGGEAEEPTDFGFYAINEGLELGHWKEVNEDLGFFENRKVIKKFEDRILAKIKAKLPQK